METDGEGRSDDGFVARLFDAHIPAKERRASARAKRVLTHTIDDAKEAVIARSAAYKRWLAHRKRTRQRLATSWPRLVPLMHLFDSLKPDGGPAAVATVEAAMPIIARLDRKGRSELLLTIGEGITTARVKAGLNPFEDSLPMLGQPPSAYDLIRALFDSLPIPPQDIHDDGKSHP